MNQETDQPADQGRVSRRRLATRGRLLDAARTVFAAKGVHGSSVEEICEAAGFTRGAFYSNYADKDDLIRDLLAREHERMASTAPVDGSARDIDSAVEAVLAAQEPRGEYFVIQTELLLHALRDPRMTPLVVETEAVLHATVAQILRTHLERLRLAPVTSLEDMTEAVVAVTQRSVRTASLAGRDDLLALARTTLPHVLRGLTRPADLAAETSPAQGDS